ncbi:Hypothetical Protein U712_20440 [Bacillus subtilis PY79]|nr:Hypothetical Protein U712_20440 [Bacillus subtilis PY79]EME07794.1 hypothetical protein BS732_1062 [Bacillus subtilis MB73/2]KZD80777.1 hypothetical protein B4417_2378 [Bacillus subtilis]CCU56896.1 hypothetical protein BSUBE1_0265 [Bacillus subtilis E1]
MGLPCKTGQTLKNVTSYALKKENGTYVYHSQQPHGTNH